MDFFLAALAYLAAGAALATLWRYQSHPVDRPSWRLTAYAALLWPAALAKAVWGWRAAWPG